MLQYQGCNSIFFHIVKAPNKENLFGFKGDQSKENEEVIKEKRKKLINHIIEIYANIKGVHLNTYDKRVSETRLFEFMSYYIDKIEKLWISVRLIKFDIQIIESLSKTTKMYVDNIVNVYKKNNMDYSNDRSYIEDMRKLEKDSLTIKEKREGLQQVRNKYNLELENVERLFSIESMFATDVKKGDAIVDSEFIYCIWCGKKVSRISKYCTFCGSKNKYRKEESDI